MATSNTALASPGVGSGLDVNGIVSKLVALERRPIESLQIQASRLQTQLSGVGQLQSLVSGLRDAVGALAEAKNFKTMAVTSSESTVLSAGASGSTPPAAGSYAITTTSLATAQSVANAPGLFAGSAALVGAGTLTIRLGGWDAGLSSFTPKPAGSDIAVSVTATDTLTDVRDKINAAGAGVSAALITDVSGVRLALQSSATGAANGFRITVADDDGNATDAAGLSRLAFDPPAGATQMQRTRSAADTLAQINGIDVASPNERLDGVIEGLSVKLAKTGSAAVNVAPDNAAIKQMVARFVSAYNALAGFVSQQTRYDAETQRAGLFQGDSTVVALQSQMRSLVGGASLASPAFQTLSSLGVELQKDGSLQVNAARLDTALADLPSAAAAFSAVAIGQPRLGGVAVRFKDWADGLLDATGALPGRNKSLQARITANQRDQQRIEQRIDRVEERLRAQYSSLDGTVARFNSLSSYVNQQLDAFRNFNSATSSK